MNANTTDIQLQLIFMANGDVNDMETIVAVHLLGVQASQEKGLLEESLNDCYGQERKNFDMWSKNTRLLQERTMLKN